LSAPKGGEIDGDYSYGLKFEDPYFSISVKQEKCEPSECARTTSAIRKLADSKKASDEHAVVSVKTLPGEAGSFIAELKGPAMGWSGPKRPDKTWIQVFLPRKNDVIYCEHSSLGIEGENKLKLVKDICSSLKSI
jgi:hypothetical protein